MSDGSMLQNQLALVPTRKGVSSSIVVFNVGTESGGNGNDSAKKTEDGEHLFPCRIGDG